MILFAILTVIFGGLAIKKFTTSDRSNRLFYNPEPLPVEDERAPPPLDECDTCLLEHKEMIKKIEKLNEEIVVLTDTHNNLKQMASIIKESLDGVRDFATRSTVSVI